MSVAPLPRFPERYENRSWSFLHNTDQRTEQDQQAVFLIAQEMADRWQAMNLRYATTRDVPCIYAARSPDRLSPKGFHHRASAVDRVIRKRLIFGLRLTSGQIPLGRRCPRISYGPSPLSRSSCACSFGPLIESMPRRGRTTSCVALKILSRETSDSRSISSGGFLRQWTRGYAKDHHKSPG